MWSLLCFSRQQMGNVDFAVYENPMKEKNTFFRLE